MIGTSSPSQIMVGVIFWGLHSKIKPRREGRRKAHLGATVGAFSLGATAKFLGHDANHKIFRTRRRPARRLGANGAPKIFSSTIRVRVA